MPKRRIIIGLQKFREKEAPWGHNTSLKEKGRSEKRTGTRSSSKGRLVSPRGRKKREGGHREKEFCTENTFHEQRGQTLNE